MPRISGKKLEKAEYSGRRSIRGWNLAEAFHERGVLVDLGVLDRALVFDDLGELLARRARVAVREVGLAERPSGVGLLQEAFCFDGDRDRGGAEIHGARRIAPLQRDARQ